MKYQQARKKKKKEYQKRKKQEKWYESKINSSIYLSGLPKNITMEEIEEFIAPGGVVRLDPRTGQKKIRLYKDDQQQLKGDAIVSYQLIQSVFQAIDILNEKQIKPGYPVTVTEAKFEQKGQQYNKRVITQQNKIEQQRIKQEMNRKFTWMDEDDYINDKGLKIVILEKMYTIQQVKEDENFLKELVADIRGQCESKLGQIAKIETFQNNPKGIVKIKFVSSLAASNCIELMDGRFFAERQIVCHFWDGKEDYKRIREKKEEEQKRHEQFGQWLQNQKPINDDGEVDG